MPSDVRMDGMKPCEVPGCDHGDAKFAPAIRLWPEGEDVLTNDHSILMRIDMALCGTHARDCTIAELVGPVGWGNLDKLFKSLSIEGKPSRQTAQVEIESYYLPERLEYFRDKEDEEGT